jgi:predicted kinase
MEDKAQQKVYLTVGNIGTGKSHFAKKAAKEGAIRICLDDFCESIHGDYVYSSNLVYIYHSTIETLLRKSLEMLKDVVVDQTLMTREKRSKYINIIKEYPGVKIVCADFGNDPAGVGLKLRLKEPRGISKEQWTQVHENFKDKYEKPELTEGIDEINRYYVV